MGDHESVVLGREAFARRAWSDAYDQLRRSEEEQHLAVGDLERLATAAFLTGRGEEATDLLEQLHHVLLDDDQTEEAARWAVWLAMMLAQRGLHAQAGGWLSRTQRLLDEADLDCAARGYLLVPAALQALGGDQDAVRALELFERSSPASPPPSSKPARARPSCCCTARASSGPCGSTSSVSCARPTG